MRKCLCILLMWIGVGLVACTTAGVNISVQQQDPATINTTRLLPSPTALQSPSSVPTELPTATSTPVPTTTEMPTISATVPTETTSASPGFTPMLVVTMQPDPYRRASLSENVWWSEDSQILYYQDADTHEAWAYDLSTGISTSIAYVPHSLHELEPQIQATLPENASIVGLSPNNHFVLYRMPLAEPIPIPDDLSVPTPEFSLPNAYTAELWVRKAGQDINLGLVDDCFGLLAPPLWSKNENVAIVNTSGSPDIACLHAVWLIDLEAVSVGPLDSPWTDNYRVLDLSANGTVFLVRSYTDRLNYLYDSTTNEQWVIPVEDTDRMILVEAGQTPSCLVFELEFSETILRDHVWYCEPITGEITSLTTIEGGIYAGIISPDQSIVAFVVVNDFPPGNFYEDVMPGIWMVALP